MPNGRVDHWIDGRRVAPRAGNYLSSIDPSLGTPWIEVPAGDADDVAAAVEAAKRAFAGPWRALPAMGRAGLLRAVAPINDRLGGLPGMPANLRETIASARASFLATHELAAECLGEAGGILESGELVIREAGGGRALSTSLFSRWSPDG